MNKGPQYSNSGDMTQITPQKINSSYIFLALFFNIIEMYLEKIDLLSKGLESMHITKLNMKTRLNKLSSAEDRVLTGFCSHRNKFQISAKKSYLHEMFSRITQFLNIKMIYEFKDENR